MSYKSWLKRKENATPYAYEANCKRCIHGEWVRTSAFCNSNGKPKRFRMMRGIQTGLVIAQSLLHVNEKSRKNNE